MDAFGPYLLALTAPFFNSLCRSREMTARDHPPLLRKKGPTHGVGGNHPEGCQALFAVYALNKDFFRRRTNCLIESEHHR